MSKLALVFKQVSKNHCMSYHDWSRRNDGKLHVIYQIVMVVLMDIIILSCQPVKSQLSSKMR